MAQDPPELTPRNLSKVLNQLTDPIKFGIQLGFPQHEMEIIKRNNPFDVEDQKLAVFGKIASNNRSMGINWGTIADALDSLQKQDLAITIRMNYCGYIPPLNPVVPDLPQLRALPPAALSSRPTVATQYAPPAPDIGNLIEVDEFDRQINEIADRVRVDHRLLDFDCDNETHLLKISQVITDWHVYAPHLGLSDQEILHIKTDLQLDASHEKALKMLHRWQQKKSFSPEGTYRFLLRKCLEINENRQQVGKICQIIKGT